MKRTPEPKVQPALVSRRDAAVYLGLTTRTIDTMATEGQISRIRMGGKTMFRIADLDRLIEQNTE